MSARRQCARIPGNHEAVFFNLTLLMKTLVDVVL